MSIEKSSQFVDSFQKLTPQKILESVEALGFHCTGRLTQLNSYENRVFEIHLEERLPLILKYYRPARWTKNQILEEHQFIAELQEDGVSAMPPFAIDNQTCFEYAGYFFSLSEKYPGRMPDELLEQDYFSLGQLIARMHNVGARRTVQYRQVWSTTFAEEHLRVLSDWIWPELRNAYLDVAETLMEKLSECESQFEFIRIHGDCHRGNLIRGAGGFMLIDFDDFCQGPTLQDFWILCADDDTDSDVWQHFLSGYTGLRKFEKEQLKIIPFLKAYRQIYYSAWIARRWKDGAFPTLFPQFQTYNYWLDELERLKKIESA